LTIGIDWTGFALAVLLVELTPGPNMAWLASLSLGQGRHAGLLATAGVALGLVVNAILAAIGFAALAMADPVWWQALRYGGTALMLWLAWQGWRDAGESSSAVLAGPGHDRRHFWVGLATNIVNPKAFLFYAAVLPQFLPPGRGWPAALALAVIGAGIATTIHLAIVAFAGHAHGWVSDPARTRTVRRLLSLGLVGVAAWMFVGGAR
jgi:threonine/homoserine/homoserine lactone efflux protein